MRNMSGSYRAMVLDKSTLDKLLLNLRELPRRVGQKHLRIALNAWGGAVRAHARRFVRKETGLLDKSLSVKVVIPNTSYNVAHHGRPPYVLVGPGRRKGRFINPDTLRNIGAANRFANTLRKQLNAAGTANPLRRETLAVKATRRAYPKAVYRNPSRYAHLVEKRYPFIRKAQEYGQRDGMAALFNRLREGIQQEARALQK